jgi:hypothetical protein
MAVANDSPSCEIDIKYWLLTTSSFRRDVLNRRFQLNCFSALPDLSSVTCFIPVSVAPTTHNSKKPQILQIATSCHCHRRLCHGSSHHYSYNLRLSRNTG